MTLGEQPEGETLPYETGRPRECDEHLRASRPSGRDLLAKWRAFGSSCYLGEVMGLDECLPRFGAGEFARGGAGKRVGRDEFDVGIDTHLQSDQSGEAVDQGAAALQIGFTALDNQYADLPGFRAGYGEG